MANSLPALFHRLREKFQRNVRYKLMLVVLLPTVLVIPLAVGIAIYWGHKLTYDQLYIKVNTDLSVANNSFQRVQQDYQAGYPASPSLMHFGRLGKRSKRQVSNVSLRRLKHNKAIHT